jgi:hypothetical protein
MEPHPHAKAQGGRGAECGKISDPNGGGLWSAYAAIRVRTKHYRIGALMSNFEEARRKLLLRIGPTSGSRRRGAVR